MNCATTTVTRTSAESRVAGAGSCFLDKTKCFPCSSCKNGSSLGSRVWEAARDTGGGSDWVRRLRASLRGGGEGSSSSSRHEQTQEDRSVEMCVLLACREGLQLQSSSGEAPHPKRLESSQVNVSRALVIARRIVRRRS